MTPMQPATDLADLRKEIDRIDAAMHGLLMERGEIIDQLIAIKRSQASGSAFRPGREASMMRDIVGRHHGILPVDIVESIWRVIIATFTHVQAPYTVHGDISLGNAAMRDVARFHFGFVVPYETHDDAGDVIHALSHSRGDLGLVPVAAPVSCQNWPGSAVTHTPSRAKLRPAGEPFGTHAEPLTVTSANGEPTMG